MSVQETVADLRSRKNGFRAPEVQEILAEWGFKLKPRGTAGHMTYTHPKLSGFFGGSFDCGHGSRGYIKACYIRDIANVLEEYADVLDGLTTGKK